jgi:hypothetical protein
VRGAPDSFGDFRAAEGSRSAGEILAHIGDLLDWALSIAEGKQRWRNSKPLAWPQEGERFFTALQALDAYLASEQELHSEPEKIFQGPVADALTHVGQIAMLRRLAALPVRGENYFQAAIEAGRVGPEQAAAAREFD